MVSLITTQEVKDTIPQEFDISYLLTIESIDKYDDLYANY